MDGSILNLSLVLTTLVLIFIVARIFWLWYFKIEERTELQKEQNELLKAILQKINSSNTHPENSKENSNDVLRKAKEYDLKYGNKE